jgi:2-polyprenyl-3-methyl-5-hydroxy-6-metoxy-1,4-benzoquinol methylase
MAKRPECFDAQGSSLFDMLPSKRGSSLSDLTYRDYGYSNTSDFESHDYLFGPIAQELAYVDRLHTILDVGCGNGSMTARFRSPGRDVYAFDLSESGANQAALNLGSNRVRVASVYDDLRELFPIRRFDAVIAVEVIEHLYDPRTFVRRIREVLRPGGTLVLTTPYHGYAKNLALAATGRLDAHFTALWDGGHIKFWSRNTLSCLLQEAGFTVRGFRGAGRLPWLWKSMIIRAQAPN